MIQYRPDATYNIRALALCSHAKANAFAMQTRIPYTLHLSSTVYAYVHSTLDFGENVLKSPFSIVFVWNTVIVL